MCTQYHNEGDMIALCVITVNADRALNRLAYNMGCTLIQLCFITTWLKGSFYTISLPVLVTGFQSEHEINKCPDACQHKMNLF